MIHSKKQKSAWEGFLPRPALVMARLATLQNEGAKTEAKVVDSLEQISKELTGCTRCPLCSQRKNIVAGEGNPSAKLVFVGEGPGEQEDLQGRPFVGKAGQLLDRMIGAMGLQRDDVFILNVVKCRPPGNRNPAPEETEACSPFLHRQLDVIRPQVIVALGKFAAQTLLGTTEGITRLRGHFFQYRGAQLMPTFHPAFLLRNPAAKREAWEDLKAVVRKLGLTLPNPGITGMSRVQTQENSDLRRYHA